MIEYGCGEGNGYGDGSGYGECDGYGYGVGYGVGYGDGTGYGECDGYGDNLGRGTGAGNGFGDGYGDGCSKILGRGYFNEEKIGEVDYRSVYVLAPWPYIRVGCETHSIEYWRENWQDIARREDIVLSRRDVDELLEKAEALR